MKKNIFILLALLLGTSTVQAQHFKNVDASLFTDSLLQPGQIHTLGFTLFLSNLDAEFGDSLALEFPLGVTPLGSSTDPIYVPQGLQEAEALNGVNGQVISWGDNNNTDTIGGIETGVQIVFFVEVMVDDTVTTEKTLRFFVSGDQMKYASPSQKNPKDHEGFISLNVKQKVANLALQAFNNPLFYRYPQRQLDTLKPLVKVRNTGGILEDFAYVIFSASDGTYYNTEALAYPFEAGADTLLASSIRIPTKVNKDYNITFAAFTDPDTDFTDNFDSLNVAITDTILGRDRGNALGNLSLSETGEIGTWLRIEKSDSLSSVSANLIGLLEGDTLIAHIYKYTFSPEDKIASSQAYVVSDIATDGWYHLAFDSLIALDGQANFFVSIEQKSPNYLGLSYNSYQVSTGSNFFRFYSDSIWQAAEASIDPNYIQNLFIRANFGVLSVAKDPTGIDAVLSSKMLVYPNPANTVLFVSNGLNNSNYELINSTGQILRNGVIKNKQVSLLDLPNGLYLLKTEQVIQKFIVKN